MRPFYVLLLILVLNPIARAGAPMRVAPSCLARLTDGDNRLHERLPLPALQTILNGMGRVHSRLHQDRYALLIDYSRNSRQKRAFLVDFKACDIVSSDYVIHGGTVYHPTEQNFGDIDGDGMLDRCVHPNGSRKYMTRPGLFLTSGCHRTQESNWTELSQGCEGIKLAGLEARNNDALSRGVVLHEHLAIPNDASLKLAGQGCPAFPPGRLKAMLPFGMFKGTMVMVYAPQCDPSAPAPPESALASVANTYRTPFIR